MKIRLSYSILSCWERGDYDGTIMRLNGNWPEPNEAMKRGSQAHERWENEIKATGNMPKDFGGTKLAEHETEVKRAIWLNDWIQLVGVVDLLEPKIGRDWKFGATGATSYANGYQHKVYQILFPRLEMFAYHSYNPYVPTHEAVESAYVHLTKETLTDGIEYVLSNACEIRDYIEKNNIQVKETVK